MEPQDLENVHRSLARHFVDKYGAPNLEMALPVAREEAAYILELCEHVLTNTVFTVQRDLDETDEIRETYRMVEKPGASPVLHTRIWDVVEDDE